jgi:adenosylmethionine-8-amino-7-oxononanoate aminotransferase
VYQAFYDADDAQKLFQGHTYAGNPICCAAALASLDVFEEEAVLPRVRDRAELLSTLLAERFADHPHVGAVRQQGLMVGVELVRDRERRDPFPASDAIGWRTCLAARDLGVFVRPLGDVIVLAPPLSIEEDELVRICEAVTYGLDQATRS